MSEQAETDFTVVGVYMRYPEKPEPFAHHLFALNADDAAGQVMADYYPMSPVIAAVLKGLATPIPWGCTS